MKIRKLENSERVDTLYGLEGNCLQMPGGAEPYLACPGWHDQPGGLWCKSASAVVSKVPLVKGLQMEGLLGAFLNRGWQLPVPHF